MCSETAGPDIRVGTNPWEVQLPEEKLRALKEQLDWKRGLSWWCWRAARRVLLLLLFTSALRITLAVPAQWSKEVETPATVFEGTPQTENACGWRQTVRQTGGIQIWIVLLCHRGTPDAFSLPEHICCCKHNNIHLVKSNLSHKAARRSTVTVEAPGKVFHYALLPAACKVKERAPWTTCLDQLQRQSWHAMASWLTTGGLVPTFHGEGEKLSCESTLHHSTGKQGLSSSGQAVCRTHETAAPGRSASQILAFSVIFQCLHPHDGIV